MNTEYLIEAYANDFSYNRGEQIQLFISAQNTKSISIDILSYPDLTVKHSINNISIRQQASNKNCFYEGCGWEKTLEWTIPNGYNKGIYFIKIYRDENSENCFYLSFIIKNNSNVKSKNVVLMNTNTWQAYNRYGGASFYYYDLSGSTKWGTDKRNNFGSVGVSFERPNHMISEDIDNLLSDRYLEEQILSHTLLGELYLIDWMFKNNYEFDLIDDSNIEDSNILSKYKNLILNCHPEYWTYKQFNSILNFVKKQQGNIINLAGNVGWARVEKKNKKLIKMGNPFDPIPNGVTLRTTRTKSEFIFNSKEEEKIYGRLYFRAPRAGDSITIHKLEIEEVKSFHSKLLYNTLKHIPKRYLSKIIKEEKFKKHAPNIRQLKPMPTKDMQKKEEHNTVVFTSNSEGLYPAATFVATVLKDIQYKITIEGEKNCETLINFKINNQKGYIIDPIFDSPDKLLGVYYDARGISTYASYNILQPEHWIFENVSNKISFGKYGLNEGGASGHETDKTDFRKGYSTGKQVLAKGTNPDNGGGEMVCFKIGNSNIFSVGSVSYTGALHVDSTAAQILKNVLKKFSE